MMMPEGPEVKSLVDTMARRYDEGRWTLTAAKVVSGRYMSDPPAGWDAMLHLLPLSVDSVQNKGKFIYFLLSADGGARPVSLWRYSSHIGARGHTHKRTLQNHVPLFHERASLLSRVICGPMLSHVIYAPP